MFHAISDVSVHSGLLSFSFFVLFPRLGK